MIYVTSDQAIKYLEEMIGYIKIYDPKIKSIYIEGSTVHSSRLDHSGKMCDNRTEDVQVWDFTKMDIRINMKFKDRLL